MDNNLVKQATLSTPTDDEIDRCLVARFLAGDESAFDEIVYTGDTIVLLDPDGNEVPC